MAFRTSSMCSASFRQSLHLHTSEQYWLAAKHGQYSLRHFVFLQWHPAAAAGCVAIAAARGAAGSWTCVVMLWMEFS